MDDVSALESLFYLAVNGTAVFFIVRFLSRYAR